jgi:hypothetical protein
MIRDAKDFSPTRSLKACRDGASMENEAISIRAIDPLALSDQRRQAAELRKYFPEVDACRKPGSAEEAEEVMTEARNSPPGYRRHQ